MPFDCELVCNRFLSCTIRDPVKLAQHSRGSGIAAHHWEGRKGSPQWLPPSHCPESEAPNTVVSGGGHTQTVAKEPVISLKWHVTIILLILVLKAGFLNFFLLYFTLLLLNYSCPNLPPAPLSPTAPSVNPHPVCPYPWVT